MALALQVVPWAAAEDSPGQAPTTALAFVQVSAGPEDTCALRPDGDARCWGPLNSDGEAPASVAGPFEAISVGSSHTCAVRSDRSIECWGSDFSGRAPARVPGSYSSVTVGVAHSCALELGGDVVCWGSNEEGQAPPRVAGPFIAVSASSAHTCALKADRNVACWGYNREHGAAPPLVVGPFTSVSTGGYSTCAVRVSGDIACWGADLYGQAPAAVTGPFTAVAAALRHTCGLTTTGSLLCWGQNAEGQAPAAAAGPFKSVSARGNHTCAITSEDLVRCWGQQELMPAPPAVPSSAPVAATVGVRYERTFVAPSSAPVAFSTQGRLPTGLIVTSTPSGGDRTVGTLSGVPREVGTFRFTVVATNMFGAASREFSVRVGPTGEFDVNRDGLPDLVVGAPGENIGSVADAGIVTVLHGARDGTYGRTGTAISQETVGQVSEKGDRFGASISVAEVTGDNQLDLIIGAPGENAGAGQVVVVHGSTAGLTGGQRTVLRQGSGGAAGSAEAGDGFGTALSVGTGGWLWVGAPGEDISSRANAGVVTVYPTRPVRSGRSVEYRQGTRGVPGVPESGDRFGASLGGGGTAIGAPGEDVGGIVDAGTVTWGLTDSVSQDTAGVPGTTEPGDRFGAAVSSRIVREVDSEGGTDVFLRLLAVGAPGEDIGTRRDAGSVTVMWKPDLEGWLRGVVQSAPSSSSAQRVEPDDRFGASVYLASSGSSLMIGAPGEDVGLARDVGAVTVLPLSLSCIDLGCEVRVGDGRTYVPGRSGVPGQPKSGTAFGASVSELPAVDGGVVAGAQGDAVDGRSSAGSITVLNPLPVPAQRLHQDSRGVPGAAERDDYFSRLASP